MKKAINKTLSSRNLSERVTIYIALLTAFANFTNIASKLIQQNWIFLGIDLAITLTGFVVAFMVYKKSRITLMQLILGISISIGMVAICIAGNSDQLFWLFPGVVALFFLLQPNVALMFSVAISVIVFPYILEFNSTTVLSFYTAMLPTIFFVYFSAKELRIQHANLNTLATEDFLTETGNRRAFQQDADISIANFNRHKIACSLIFFDMDHFKNINDTYGHSMGDTILRTTAKLIEQRLRRTDRLYRLGGEEFAILINHADLTESLSVGQDLRSFIHKNCPPELPKFTISFGVSQLKPEETLDNWMRRTDKALYASKNNGRDQITTAA